MKRILFILIAIIISGSAFSQGINFEHSSFNEVLRKAEKENKLVFMDCYTSWCGPCKYLAKNIFPQKEVGDYFNQHFVSFKVDMEKGEGIDLCKKYQVKSFPTLLFLNHNGQVVHKMVGGMPADELIAGAKCAIDPNLRIGTLKSKYDKGNREYEFLMTYLTALKRQYDRENIALVSNDLIEKYSLERFLTKDLFYVVGGTTIKYGSKEFHYLLGHKNEIIEEVGDKEYTQVIENSIKKYLIQCADSCRSLKDLNAEISKCKKVHMLQQQERVESSLVYSFYLAQGQFKKWFDLKLKEAEQQQGNQKFYMLLGIGEEVVKNPKFNGSNESIERALKLGHDIADTNNGIIMGNFLLAKLYLKKGDKEKALKHFNLFFENNGKAGGNNTHPTVTRVKEGIDNL